MDMKLWERHCAHDRCGATSRENGRRSYPTILHYHNNDENLEKIMESGST
jgi:hypothetical protein